MGEMAPLMEQDELTSMRPWGLVFQGWVQAERGDLAAGIRWVKAGVDAWQEIGAVSGRTCQMVPLISAYVRAGMLDEARASVEESLALVERTGERLFERELLELREESLAQK